MPENNESTERTEQMDTNSTMDTTVLPTSTATASKPVRTRPRFNFFMLFTAIVALAVSVYLVTDGRSWLPEFDLRWVLATGAIVVGALMFIASLRTNKDD